MNRELNGHEQKQSVKALSQGGDTWRSACDPPPAGVLAIELTKFYQNRLAWNKQTSKWFEYEAQMPGIWAAIFDESLERKIQDKLDDDMGCVGNYAYSLVNSTNKLMRGRLLVPRWDEQPGLLPLQDGVLDLASMLLLPHAPEYRFTYCLPYKWEARLEGCEPVKKWLLEAMQGDHTLVDLLRAYLKAVLTRRVDLQRFLECLGPGGSGKGTFMRLATALVGHQNVHVSTLRQLENNRFEGAALYKKLLLLITEAERFKGQPTQLKAITGQDRIRYEAKNIQQSGGFEPTCMVIVAANEPVLSGDSGLERRRLPIPFFHQVKPEDRRDLEREFKPFLPGLLAWVLEMPDERVTELVRNGSSTVQALAQWNAEKLLETHPLAEWLDACVVHDPSPDIKTQVGVAKRSTYSSNSYLSSDKWLYASYCEYVDGMKSAAISQRQFSGLLLDLCANQLKLEGVRKGRDQRGAYFKGLVIRCKDDDNSPRPITGMTTQTPAADGYDANVVLKEAMRVC